MVLLYADINNPSNIGSTMNEEFINIQSSQTVSFLDKNIGALICNDIGNRNYDNIYAEAMDEYKRTHAGSFNPEDIVFHNMMTEKLNNNPNITAIYGYKLIDFASGAYDGENYNDECGFQGGIYYNETTGDYVVVCRGTEFDFSSEERYRDFVKTDVCGFGQDEIPDDFKETKKLLDNLLKNGVAKSQIHIVGHSLGGGASRVGKAGSGSLLHKFSSYKCYIFKSSILRGFQRKRRSWN